MRALRTLALLLLVSATPFAQKHRVRPLADFPEERTEIREWMKRHEWKSKRNSPRRFELEGGRLHLVSRDDSVLIGTDHGLPLDPATWPRLRFRLRVDEVPTGTKLTRKSGDDAACRLYVAFDEGGGCVTIERNLLADYRRVFGAENGPVPDLVGLMLKCDSNDTGTSASAWLAELELVAPERRDD